MIIERHCRHCKQALTKACYLVCEECWDKLPGEIRGALYVAYKREPGGVEHRVAARRALEYLKNKEAKK